MSNTTDKAPWRKEYPFESHWLDADGHRLHYVDEGDGPAIVMVHGNPTWSFFYRKLIPALADEHRVIAVDNMGCGLSDKPQNYPYRLETHTANLERLIDALGLEKLDLVMHDWGAPIAMGYAVAHPDTVQRLIVMNSAAFLIDRCPWQIRLCRCPLLGTILLRRLNVFPHAALHMAVNHRERLTRAIRDGYLAPYNSFEHRVAVQGFVKDIPMTPDHPTWNVLATTQKRLGQLASKPMMICWGMQDFCFNEQFLDTWIQHFPDAIVHRFSDASHYVLEDAYERVIPLAHDFLERTASATPHPGRRTGEPGSE